MTTAAVIADYLDGLGLVTKSGAGRDVFQRYMRDEPDDAVLIATGSGRTPDMSHDLRRIRNPIIAITVRAADDNEAAGEQRADDIFEAMLVLNNTAFGGERVIGAVAIGEVLDMGRDDRDRFAWSMNFLVKKP